MEIAFTIGYCKSYDAALSSSKKLFKLGKDLSLNPPYEGGWVWKTFQEAENFLKTASLNFEAKIYGLKLTTSWIVDVSKEKHADGVYRLINDAEIFQIESGMKNDHN